MTPRRFLRTTASALGGAAALLLFGPAGAQGDPARNPPASPAGRAPAAATAAPPAPASATRSGMDSLLFYQVLLGEMQLREGQPGAAFSLLLDAARRSRDEELFRRAVDIALQSRAGDEALNAARAWRSAAPNSLEAVRTQLQILGAMNRTQEAAEPLAGLLALTPEADRGALMASLPRFFRRSPDARATATLLEKVLQPYVRSGAHRATARSALGSAWLAAGEPGKALALAREAAADDPGAPAPALLALETMPRLAQAESIVRGYLGRPQPLPAVRLVYARLLAQASRHAEAIEQLEAVTAQQPDVAGPWLTLGALHLDLKHAAQAEAALRRYVELAERGSRTPAADGPEEREEEREEAANAAGLSQAWLLRAQAAELRGDFAAAEAFLARVDGAGNALEVQTRRATILARQGRVDQAREALRKLPEGTPEQARAKLMAEAQVLREVRRWRDAYNVLRTGGERWPEDADLLYEQAMMAEKLDRLDDMERLLRRVMALRPDSQHAYNALGYTLADRGIRLREARELIVRALELAPGDPFITDSLGWVEFRLGNLPEALRLLRQAYAARPDTEIAAHLGEVLWVSGQREEALRIWREGRSRDAANDVLRETLARLKPDL